ncbi:MULTISPECIES: bifunctional adenosylcobinamide kinase/adenosylcobinamide-phosphate guanylyltransferase [Mumia]|uniref:bifunctional adenosylcobinamide kinase/adenosylcobinamide-phosphate guanylyltransferase n=1 Tax=Mumia TaxID=1546255 RepID=UPI00142187F5|nr:MULTISPECIES: bifunctional adenosylcobinamide kinase/adenosylcobinamide-phosphate guanylyltransferase [unclassified Mumia]QMW66007.1 bifunctional adenosylcobinamide kinase/adenosylcobinamide-phosphate guanylyltransferase [Mumia sp. ZJ1417]
MGHRVLVTGGVRSGKSRYAESLLQQEPVVTYIAPGPAPDGSDPEWSARVADHQSRRPDGWVTTETTDVASALEGTSTPVIVDCLGTWVTAMLDELGAWDAPDAQWRPEVGKQIDSLVEAWCARRHLSVAVTNEVGFGVVPEHRSGRVFRDVLGLVNQRVAECSDEVALVVAGRVLYL